MKPLLTPMEVSELLKINYNRVLDLIHLGEINAVKIGKNYRVYEGDLFDYLNTNKYKSYWKKR
ncbi:MAG: hypothetical protein COA72_01840 [Candidatus Neomarinimicrobiota bacterium]|jgi:excisionase family DNA binding protein|nr:MAG: hypothetical protein COA72_01840 [Candidatus Neomarinimicrobiota bacterium]HIN20121.1 DNA-binding protein [Candidatus Neomarinimicrobiota bacterium]|tara:strand:- start:1407 stop:1595 length:189 start_codon:yes stop_codon:yes gene_type:complete